MKNQIVITCSEDGAYLLLKNGGSAIGLTKGENVLTVAEFPELAYGFTTLDNETGEDCGEYIESIDLSYYDTSKVKDMSYMFARCYNLKSLDINMDTSNVTNMFGMFENCHSLEQIHFHQFDTSKVDDMGWMFAGCCSLETLDVSCFDTSKVCSMESMFAACHSLQTLNLNNFNTSNVTNMGFMFGVCSSLQTLNLSNFNTSNVTNMGSMFEKCSSIQTLDLRNFNTSNVRDMKAMFLDCHSLIYLDISSFDFSRTMRKKNMFKGCKKDIGIDLDTIKFYFDDDMRRNGMKYKIGSDYCYEMDSIFGTIAARGVVVYNNGIVAVARVWHGDFEMISSLEADNYTYTEERIAGLFNDFTDNHIRFQCEKYLLIDLKTNALVPCALSDSYIMD